MDVFLIAEVRAVLEECEKATTERAEGESGHFQEFFDCWIWPGAVCWSWMIGHQL